jgi:hypothetical protein
MWQEQCQLSVMKEKLEEMIHAHVAQGKNIKSVVEFKAK